MTFDKKLVIYPGVSIERAIRVANEYIIEDSHNKPLGLGGLVAYARVYIGEDGEWEEYDTLVVYQTKTSYVVRPG